MEVGGAHYLRTDRMRKTLIFIPSNVLSQLRGSSLPLAFLFIPYFQPPFSPSPPPATHLFLLSYFTNDTIISKSTSLDETNPLSANNHPFF